MKLENLSESLRVARAQLEQKENNSITPSGNKVCNNEHIQNL
jgi:hypothetical protein